MQEAGYVSALGLPSRASQRQPEALPQSAWDAYYTPIRENLAVMRADDPGLPHSQIDDELRIWDSGLGPEWWVYGVFVARAV